MRKFYLFKLGFLTSTLCNCGLQEAEFQVQNENYGKNLTKSLKDLRTCLQNASYKNRQEQNAIKSNQTTLTGDIAELAKKFESRIKEKENAINTLQEQLIKQSEALDDLNKQKDQLANLKTELTNKIDQSKLDEEIQKHTKELETKLTEKVNEINKLQKEIDALKKQILDLNTETKQKLEKQNLGINRIGEYLNKEPNKKNKTQFKEDWKIWTETNIKSPRKGILTSKSKLGQEKSSDD